MARSKETSSKREKEEKKRKKRKEKDEKREARKSTSNKGKGFESMIAYVDENGNFSDTPPDPSLRKELKLEDIQLGARPDDAPVTRDFSNKGRVSYYNEAKGYGFIKDSNTKESVFFYLGGLGISINLNDQVSFQKVKGPKGMSAVNISKID